MWWREAATSGRGSAPRSAPPRPPQPGGRAGPAPPVWAGGGRGQRQPALTPGGGRGPSPRQGRRCGAVPRKGFQGPRTKRPRLGKAGQRPAARAGDPFRGTLGILFVGQAPLSGRPSPRQWWMPESYPKASPASGSTSVPLSPSSTGRAEGPAFPPSARPQHKAGPGEGKGRAGSPRSEAVRHPAVPSAGARPSRAAQLRPRSWSPRLPSASGPTSRHLRGRLGPAPRRRPTASGPQPGPRSRADAPACSRGAPLRPNLPPPKGPAPGLGGSGLN